MTPAPDFTITVGAGRNRPQGSLFTIGEEPSVAGLLAALAQLPAVPDSWWSGHVWAGNYRESACWLGTWALPVDLDYQDEVGEHAAPPPGMADKLIRAAVDLPGNIFHPTPRGARIVRVLDQFLDDPQLFQAAAREVATAVDAELRRVGLAATKRRVRNMKGQWVEKWCCGYKVDDPTITDRARFYYSPQASVDGVARVAELRVLSETLHTVPDSIRAESEPAGSHPQAQPTDRRPFRAISKAAAAYNEDHPRRWPASGGTCPACGHHDCFGTHPENPLRWTCFSAAHASDSGGCGRQANRCWSGDALDLAAYAQRLTRVELLKRAGYLHTDSGRRGDRGQVETEPLHAWDLSAGTFRLLGWPDEKRALFVTLEFIREGVPRHRDNVDLNSARARKRFASAALGSVPDPLGSTAEILEQDLLELIGLVAEVADTEGDVGASARESVADRLVELAGEVTLFHDADDRAYAHVQVDGHGENWPLRQKRFRKWLAQRYFAQYRSVANATAVQDAIAVLEGLACFDGETRRVFVRIAADEEAVYVDLGTEDWAAVRIDAAGWAIEPDPPVAFIRPKGLRSLPKPATGGSLRELRRFVNVRDEHDWILFQAWLVCSLRHGRPFLIMVVFGEQGSAKTTGQRVARRLIDPNVSELRSPPRSERDLVIACRNGWCLGYDNLSRLPQWLSDALSRIATGSGFGTRTLYTDDEEELFDGMRPIAINGIEEVATRGDLLDRSVLLCFQLIDEKDRKDEGRFWREFEEARPRILGALFDAVSVALRRLDGISPDRLPRMADAARWVIAAEPALDCEPGAFLRAYAVNRGTVHRNVLDSSVLGQAIVVWASKLEGGWTGTATELLALLNSRFDEVTREAKGWPKTPSGVAGQLTRLAPSLRGIGIGVEMKQEGGAGSRKLIRIVPQDADAADARDAKEAPAAEEAGKGVGGVAGVGELQNHSGGGGGEDSIPGPRTSDACDCRCPDCGAWISARTAELFGGLCSNCHQNKSGDGAE